MIITRQHYEDLQQCILNKSKQIEQLQRKIRRLENDKRILKNIINPDIADLDFPNSDERGLTGEPDTPDLNDIWDM